jgi:NADH:ubiquinone oxidoreductase subunit 6 (subunit J)
VETQLGLRRKGVSLVAVISGAATVVSRSPVYAAIWFALALAGVAGVLLVLGAQFLGVATIVVYAGAILVMFLFVLMLAQPAGMAPYDRVSNEPLLSAVAGAVLLGILSLTIGRLTAEPPACCLMPATKTALLAGSATAADGEATDSDRGSVDLLAENHVARLGGELFGRHLLADGPLRGARSERNLRDVPGDGLQLREDLGRGLGALVAPRRLGPKRRQLVLQRRHRLEDAAHRLGRLH